MDCTRSREALSARLDGEEPGPPAAALDAHVAACPGCRDWTRAAATATRRVRVAPAVAVPDLTAAVLAALPPGLPGGAAAARARLVGSGLRLALVLVGAVQAALAWPALVHGVGAMSAPVHLAHETGAWNLALAVTFLAVAVAPRLAAGALPLLATFVAVLTWVTVGDLAAGRVDVDRAVGHLLLLTGLLLVVAVAWRGRRHRGDRAVVGGLGVPA